MDVTKRFQFEQCSNQEEFTAPFVFIVLRGTTFERGTVDLKPIQNGFVFGPLFTSFKRLGQLFFWKHQFEQLANCAPVPVSLS